MKETIDNVEQLKEEIGQEFICPPLIAAYQFLFLDKITHENFGGKDAVIVSFGKGNNVIRLNLSIEQANELSIRLGFVLQDIEREANNGKKSA